MEIQTLNFFGPRPASNLKLEWLPAQQNSTRLSRIDQRLASPFVCFILLLDYHYQRLTPV